MGSLICGAQQMLQGQKKVLCMWREGTLVFCKNSVSPRRFLCSPLPQALSGWIPSTDQCQYEEYWWPSWAEGHWGQCEMTGRLPVVWNGQREEKTGGQATCVLEDLEDSAWGTRRWEYFICMCRKRGGGLPIFWFLTPFSLDYHLQLQTKINTSSSWCAGNICAKQEI